jgi:hypothetical protein
MRKNLLLLEPICHREKLEEVERKLPVVLVKTEDRWRSPTPSVEFMGRKAPSSALHTAHNRLKVS